MLKVALSKLETARKDPTFVAQSLANGEKSGGGQGFVSCFKTVARDFHKHDRDLSYSVEDLNQKLWASFKECQANTKRRKAFCESFEEYNRCFKEMELSVDRFQINLDWQLIRKTKLTGHSPFLCSNDEFNIAYFFTDQAGQWQKELKYPLLQIYLAERFYECDVDKVKIGVYSIPEKGFDLRTYEDFELDNALEEGKSVLGKVASAYSKFLLD